MTDPRMTQDEIARLAQTAVNKIDLLEDTGADQLNTDEIVAMALLLVLNGLVIVYPHKSQQTENQIERTS